MRERWQPIRSGFVNLYRYDREEFHYENGRLLLRGNNGTGKSRVLALQLPFLFDGDVNPQRLEPDADPSKKIEWNLLMDRYPERTGYTWIEFGRRDEAGNEHYLTLGCGLSALQSKAGVRQWFFLTTQRIGKDLELASASGQVFGKDRLREKIATAGQVFDTVGAYRRAVNEALFGLDEYRYASLMNLLIQLRRPQLTRRLDEQDLSRALSEALPPLPPAVVGKIAEAFSSLSDDRRALDARKAALVAVDRFLTTYRSYAETAARRRANQVIAAHYEYEDGMREILAAEAECDKSVAELARLRNQLQMLATEEHALQAQIAAFQENPRTQNAVTLERALHEATERRRDADSAAVELAEISRLRQTCFEEHVRARAHLDNCQNELDAAKHAVDEAAERAGIVADNTEKRDQELDRARRANDDFRRARAECDHLAGLLNDAVERLKAAREDHQNAVTSFLDSISDWTANLAELPLPFDEAFLASVMDWCEQPRGPNPFAAATQASLDQLTRNFADLRAELKLDGDIDALDELDRRENKLRAEAATIPQADAVRNAYEYSGAVSRHLESLRKRVAEAETLVTKKKAEVTVSAADLESAQRGLAEYRLAQVSVRTATGAFQTANAAVNAAWARFEQVLACETRQKELATRLEQNAVAAEIARDAAAEVAGGRFEQIIKRIKQARHRLDEVRREERHVRSRYHDVEVAVTRLDERLRNRTEMFSGQTDRRASAMAALETLAATGLLELAGFQENVVEGFSPRNLMSIVAAPRAGALDYTEQQKLVTEEFATLMQAVSSLGCESSAAFRDDLFVSRVLYRGRECSMSEFRQILLDDVNERQRQFDAKESEVLHQMLGNVTDQVQELIGAAEEQVREMNAELDSRPMSTGMKLRFVWRSDEGPMLDDFLHRRIRAVCLDTEDASWEESLGEALDYRKWHRFTIERFQDGVWKRLTQRTHGTGSGGEKAVALTLPHFAAAAAFYRSADPRAPRLILLDEAFAGIDADMRAKCMGLIDAFDLDFVMTSEREWGCYPTVPGLAIYQLSTRPGIDAIGITRWVWKGREREVTPQGSELFAVV